MTEPMILPPGVSSGYLRLGGSVKGKWAGGGYAGKTAPFAIGERGPEAVIPNPEPKTIEGSLHVAPTDLGPAMDARAVARGSGYTGDQCTNCNSMRMQVSGHCTVCADCGTSSGCS